MLSGQTLETNLLRTETMTITSTVFSAFLEAGPQLDKGFSDKHIKRKKIKISSSKESTEKLLESGGGAKLKINMQKCSLQCIKMAYIFGIPNICFIHLLSLFLTHCFFLMIFILLNLFP